MTQWLQGLVARRAGIGRSSTASRVADALRADITEGSLPPGTRLSEEEIGAALGISRNTLREAFRLLTHEQLLVHEFNRGVFVRRLTTEDVRDLYRVRRVLEAAALRCAPGAPPERLEAIRVAVEDGERAAASGDWTGVGSANMYFHQAVAGLVDSPRLDETMRQLLAELRLVFHVMADPHAFHRPYLQGNREIYELLRDGKVAAAEQALAGYLDVAEKQLLDAMG